MALYPDALKTYQDYLSGGGSTFTKTTSNLDGATATRLPAPTTTEETTLREGATNWPTEAPSVPTSTNAETADLEPAPIQTAITGEAAGAYDPFADLASMYSDNIVSRGGAENWPSAPPPPEPDPVPEVTALPAEGADVIGEQLADNELTQNFPVDPMVDIAPDVTAAPEYQGDDPFQDLADAVAAGNEPDRQGVENWPDDPTPPRQGAENWPTDWTNVGDAPGSGGGAGPYGEDVDALIEQALRDLLAGQRDTAEEEAMMLEKNRADMLEGVVDNQARMGALGFGASGALAGLEADIRGRASRDATDQILGLRQDARDDWLRRVGTGLGADLTRREFASREAARDAYSELLRDMMDGGLDDAEGPPPELGFTDPQEYKDQGFTEVVSSRAGGNSSSPYIVHTVRNPETGETATVTVPYNEGTGWGEY